GILFDFLAESLYIGWLPDRLETIQRLGTILSGMGANTLYTLGGVVLTLATPWGRLVPRWRWLPALAWAAWAAGLALSLSSLANFAPGLLLSGAALIIF